MLCGECVRLRGVFLEETESVFSGWGQRVFWEVGRDESDCDEGRGLWDMQPPYSKAKNSYEENTTAKSE